MATPSQTHLTMYSGCHHFLSKFLDGARRKKFLKIFQSWKGIKSWLEGWIQILNSLADLLTTPRCPVILYILYSHLLDLILVSNLG